MDLKIDPLRAERPIGTTGIYVRARDADGKMQSVDIVIIDRASLIAWLRKDGGYNPIAEGVVLILLDHEPLTAKERHENPKDALPK